MKNIVIILILLTNTDFVISQDNDLEILSLNFKIRNFDYGWNVFGEEIIPDKYIEIFAGYQSIRPFVTVKNNSSEFKETRIRVTIHNQNKNKLRYNKYLFVGDTIIGSDDWSIDYFYFDSTGNEMTPPFDTNGWALPPKGTIKVGFSPFETNAYWEVDFGRFIVKAYSTEYKNNIDMKIYDSSYSKFSIVGYIEELPWDHFKTYVNTSDSVKKIKSTFPDNIFWGSSGVEVVDGTRFCHNTNLGLTVKEIDSKWDTSSSYGMIHTYKDSLITNLRPVFRLNRVNELRNEYGNNGRFGDTLISGVIDLRDKPFAKIIIECQRTGKLPISFDRGWADKMLYGPEHRVILNGNCDSVYREPDKLIVDLAFSNNIYELMNPSDTIWNRLKDSKSEKFYLGEPALILFGGGGSYSGLPDKDKPNSIPGLNCDLYDHGKDNEFKNYHLNLPDYMLNNAKGGFVRIRFRVDAKKNGNGFVHDDYDDFFIQNVFTYLEKDYEHEDLSVSKVNLINPYSIVPNSMYTRFPLSLNISHGRDTNYSFEMFIKIKINNQISIDDYELYSWYDPGYLFGTNYLYRDRGAAPMYNAFYGLISLPDMNMYMFEDYPFKGNNLFLIHGSAYRISKNIHKREDDYYENNDIYSLENLNFDEFYAYDKPEPQNDVEIESESDIIGLSLLGNSDGFASWENSYGAHSGSGQIAMKFLSYSSNDTIYGFQAYFPDVSQSQKAIGFSVYKNNSNNLPGELIPSSVMIRKTGYDELSKEFKNKGYITYLYGSDYDTLQEPLQLDRGTYWLAIAQYDEAPLNLGASGYRMGMITTNYDAESNGANGTNILIEDCWKLLSKDDNRLIQQNYFAYENEYGSGNWKPFTSITDNPAYSHLDHAGTVRNYKTFTRGSFVPMLRIYMNGSHYKWKEKPNDVEDINADNLFKITPNPASEYIEITVGAHCNAPVQEIKIYNTYGQCAINYQFQITNYYENVKIDVSHLPVGMYFVRFNNKIMKFIKM